jgi:signal transduction histidine kinase
MFTGLSRRLTGWYVLVATSLVILLAGALAVAGLVFYAHVINEQLTSVADQIADVDQRSRAAHEDFPTASKRLLERLKRPGLLIRLMPPPPFRPNAEGRPQFPDVRPLNPNGHRLMFRDPGGPGGPSDSRAAELQKFRVGYATATFLGIHFERRPFLGGLAIVTADGARVQTIVGISVTIVLLMGVIAGLFAWTVGRFITLQALRPLYEVTSALQRFAARDFTAQAIESVGRGEFNQLAAAYNAAAAQVEEAFAEREAVEYQMRQFVADAGHELRTPLTIVLGYIDILRKRAGDDERSRKIFETIAIESSRMRTLIDNLVLLARLDSDEVRTIEPFDLVPLLLNDIVEPRRSLTPNARFDLDLPIDATIIGERSEIQEAIANIVDNALKYAPGSPIRISVSGASGGVEIRIADDGPGIPPTDRDQIFERFYRGAQRGEIEGSGLGLAIAKRAVERSGGTLVLSETSENGTTFAIRLRADQTKVRAAVVARA